MTFYPQANFTLLNFEIFLGSLRVISLNQLIVNLLFRKQNKVNAKDRK